LEHTGWWLVSETGAAALAAGLFGLIFGSFFNVCIHRLPFHRSIMAPRSQCPKCERPIAWYNNIPLLSFVLLRGRCRFCGAAITWRYPVVELATALLFYAIVREFGVTPEAVKWLIFVSLLEMLFWTDLETRLLPDVLTLGGLAAALCLALVIPMRGGMGAMLFPGFPVYLQSEFMALVGAFLLSVPLWAIAKAYARLRGIEPPGLGDIKLLALLGASLGVQEGVLAVLIGSLAGSVLGLGYILGTGKNPRTHTLPFGSFLCVGGLIVIFFGGKLVRLWMGAGM
jgi:leader peptidase (prepilin peptidase) / N-methyltransferase